MFQDNLFRELVIDNFAGGGGASTGMELALGVPVDIAINHDADAIAMHKVNHPYTMHYQEDVFAIDPETVTGGRPVGAAWFSPDCKHFSRAKGGKPVEKKIRGLSWVILKWAMSKVAPRVIFMENVPEIQTWGPLVEIDGKNRPDPKREGETFRGFIAMLTKGIDKSHAAFAEACEFLHIDPNGSEADRLSSGLGYDVKWKELKACDYGAPTIRKRFYLIARRDGKPIVFPTPTHGPGRKPYRTAAECIDWSIPCPSIFGRKKDLAVNTQRRIARGLDKFVIKNPRPFILQVNFENAPQDANEPLSTVTTVNKHYAVQPKIEPYVMSNNTNNACHGVKNPLPTVTTGNRNFLCSPSIIQYHSEQSKSEVRGQKADEPIMTIDGSPRYGVNACYLSKYFSGEKQAGADVADPLLTVTGVDHNAAVAANLIQYYGGADQASKADNPLPTVTCKDRHGLIESHLCVLRKNTDCKAFDKPLPTLTTSAGHFAQVVTYIQKLDSTQNLKNWWKVRELLNQYAGYNIADDEILILEINGVQHFIADVGMRMLKAKELKLAQGFPKDYVIDIEPYIGKKYSEQKQIARLGNAVCPPVATALVRANLSEMETPIRIESMQKLYRVICGDLSKKRKAG